MELVPHAALGFHTLPSTSERVEGLRVALGRTRPKGRTERTTRPKGRATRSSQPSNGRPGTSGRSPETPTD